MAADTKERILIKALEMFSESGYNGTNLRDLAKELDLSKSALYRHFTSKEEIWNAVLETMIAYYDINFGSAENMPVIPKTTDELYEMTMQKVNFTINDERIIRMRKLLLTEQFRDARIKALATNYFMNDTEAIYAKVFETMMNNKVIKKCDPKMAAFAFTSPITVLIHLCDREPEKKDEAIKKIRKFIKMFISEYGI